MMRPQISPSSLPAQTLDKLYDMIADLSDETPICAMVIPFGIQVEFFYEDFTLVKALYSFCGDAIDVTHVIYEASDIHQHIAGNAIKEICRLGDFDVSGTLYVSPHDFQKINVKRALEGVPTFHFMDSLLVHILQAHDYVDCLKFTPNWSSHISNLPGMTSYTKVLELFADDFAVTDHIKTTVKAAPSIENYYNHLRSIDPSAISNEFTPRSLLLIREDIDKRRVTLEGQIIGEILFGTGRTKVRIDTIEPEPDRYGRVRPIITTNEVSRHEYEYYTITLPRMDTLDTEGYETGDIVELEFIYNAPRLGKILKKSSIKQPPVEKVSCLYCHIPFIKKHGQLYCVDSGCPSAVFNRVVYASSKRALDLPFEQRALNHMVLMNGSVYDIPSLLAVDRQVLMPHYDTDMQDRILSTVKRRLHMLNGGHKITDEVKNLTQGRFLDALSLGGLHEQNIRRLRHSLWVGDFAWAELPLVLTDRASLLKAGLVHLDADEIIGNARARLRELEALVKDF